jgi:hypothetical protein
MDHNWKWIPRRIDIEDFIAKRMQRGAAPTTANEYVGLISECFCLA